MMRSSTTCRLFALSALALLASSAACCKAKGTSVIGSGGNATTESALDFGKVGTGTTHVKGVPIKNTGNGPLLISALTLTGDASFSTPALSQTVEPGQTITVAVTFHPTSDGTKNGKLQIVNDGDSAPTSVTLTGIAFTYQLEVSPASLNFGTVQVGTTSQPQTTVATNSATLPEDITATLAGPNASDFQVSPTGLQAAVGAGSAITYSLTFSPTQPLAETAELDLSPCNGCVPVKVQLTGTGTTTTLVLNPAYTNFMSVPQGQTVSATLTVTAQALPVGVQNPLPATLTAVPTYEQGNQGFGTALSGTWPSLLTDGQSVTLSVTFTSSGAASPQDTLDFAYTVGAVVATPAKEPVSAGQMGSPCSMVAVVPPAVFFGNVQNNKTANKSVVLTNNGPSVCTLSMIGINPNDPQNDFSTSAATQYALSPGQSQSVQVTFAPTSNASPYTRVATLGFSTSDTFLPRISVPLSATVGNSAYAPSAWPKWHRDNANSGLSTADTSSNQGTAVWGSPVLVGPPVPSTKFPNDLATTIFSPVVGIDMNGNDVVYTLGYGPMSGNTGNLYAVQGNGPNAGQIVWSQPVTQPEALAQECTPTIVADNSLYLMTGGEQGGKASVQQFYHFSQSGAPLWADDTNDTAVFNPTIVDGFDTSPGLAPDGTMYLFNDDGPSVYAFSTTGSQPVQLFTGAGMSRGHMESYSAALTDTDESVFSWGGLAQAFDNKGNKLWDNGNSVLPGMASGEISKGSSSCGNDGKGSPVLLGSDAVVSFGGYDSASCSQAVGGVQAFNLQTGAVDWTYTFPTIASPPAMWVVSYQKALVAGFSSPALLGDGGLVVGWGDGVYALDPPTTPGGQPTLRWKLSTGLVISSPAVGADGTVFVGSTDGNLYGINGQTGHQKFAFNVGRPVNSSPAIGSDGTVYFTADDGNLYAVK